MAEERGPLTEDHFPLVAWGVGKGRMAHLVRFTVALGDVLPTGTACGRKSWATGDYPMPQLADEPHCSRREFQETVRSGDRMAVMVVASIWENEHGTFWAAYLGDATDKTARGEIANTGAKMPRNMAEGLFPQIVAAGYEWWD